MWYNLSVSQITPPLHIASPVGSWVLYYRPAARRWQR